MIKIFAHRGYSSKYPENTLLSFQKAIDTGCGGIELDVQRTKDGVLVIIHDEDVKRTTNGAGLVKDLTFSELQKLDAGKGQRIPALAEYMDLVKNLPLVTNIELKNNIIPYEGIEAQTLAMIREHALEDRIILSSFDHTSVILCKSLAPEIPCGFLCGGKASGIGKKMREYGVEYLHPYYRSLDGEFLEEILREDIPINVWTVDGESEARHLLKLGSSGIFTNMPARLMAICAYQA